MPGIKYWLPTAMLAGLFCVFTLAGLAGDDDSLWHTNFEEAKAKARSEDKLLLLDFTGSDWCGWCIRLKREVFEQEVFQKEAPQRFVLVQLDFPQGKELPAEIQKQNEQLRERFSVSGFPTILLLDAEGQLIARTGYRPGGAEEYLKHLDQFVTAHQTIVQMRGDLADARGLDRARLLDQLIEAYGALEIEADEIEAWTREIIALDGDNEAGLKVKYQFLQSMADADALKRNQKFDEAKAVYDAVLEMSGINNAQKQEAHFARGECFFHAKDFVGVVACLKQAAEAAPDSAGMVIIQDNLERFAPLAEAQETAAEIREKLDASEGTERARLLDGLLEARTALSRAVPDPELAHDTDSWAREIVALDTENSAGLKGKYGVRLALADAQQLVRDRKPDEAHAVLDKALAIPGVAEEPLQELYLAKANYYAAQQEFQKSVEACQRALDAAPSSPRVRYIIKQMEAAQAELDKQKSQDEP